MTITQYNIDEDQYFPEIHGKKQIYLHHTAGGTSPYSTIDWWKKDPGKIATCVVIAGKSDNSKYKDGEIVQAYPSKYWSYHLGIKQAVFEKYGLPYQSLDKLSIGIEICNWGQLTKTDKGFITYVGSEVKDSEVIELETEHRGYKYYHKYSEAQIEAVRDLLVKWNEAYGIPIKYNGDSIFDICPSALKGAAGVYTHCSVRSDKNDISPQPLMIEMLKSL